MTTTMSTPGLLDELLARTSTPRADCRVWNGATDRGYGRIWVDGTAKRAHRVAWELTHGAVPEGYEIDHLCRIRACVNTDHMELVEHAENIARAKPHRPSQPSTFQASSPAELARLRRLTRRSP